MYPGLRDDALNWFGQAEGLVNYLDAMAELGVAGLEVYVDRSLEVPDYSRLGQRSSARFALKLEEQRKEFVETLRSHGVRVSAILIENDFGRDDLESEINWAVGVTSVAPDLGTDVVRVNSVMSPNAEREQSAERTAKAIKEILRRSEGVYIAMENHGVVGNDPDFIRDVMRRVRDERLALNIDPGNFYWAGYPLSKVYSFVEEFAPLAKHMHVKNMSFRQELRESRRDWCRDWPKEALPVYEGDIDYSRVLEIMKKAGYNRDVTLEDESLGNYDKHEGLAIMRRDVEYIKGLLAKV
ncbi:sugar phosphate isomerase/epimerase [Tardisphaera miroshnichenkoae]